MTATVRASQAEYKVQAAIVEYLRLVLPDAEVFHVPNGELRDKRLASKLRYMGVLAGVPDIIIWASASAVYGLEVKTDAGALTGPQKAWQERAEAHGRPYAVVRSVDDTRDALAGWGVETREVTA